MKAKKRILIFNIITLIVFTIMTIGLLMTKESRETNLLASLFMSVIAACLASIFPVAVEYSESKRRLLESFLKELIHCQKMINAEMVIAEGDERYNNTKIDLAIEALQKMRLPRSGMLSNLWADSDFFFNNKRKRELLYSIYKYQEKIADELAMLQCNIDIAMKYCSEYQNVAAGYIIEMENKGNIIEQQIDEKGRRVYFNKYLQVLDKEIRDIKEMTYGKRMRKVKEQEHEYILTYQYLNSDKVKHKNKKIKE